MSSTNRGGKRSEADFYATPPWVTHRLLDQFDLFYPDNDPKKWSNLPGGRWLEPCAGDGEIIRAVRTRRNDIIWSACELRPEMESLLRPHVDEKLVIGDLLGRSLADFGGVKFDVAITNPPFRIALPVVKKCLELAKNTVMLLRLNFWGSEERQQFLMDFPPDTYVLPNRPMFSTNKEGKPGTDSPEYAWFVWGDPEQMKVGASYGEICVLKLTPREERKKWADHLRERYQEVLRREIAATGSQEAPRGTNSAPTM